MKHKHLVSTDLSTEGNISVESICGCQCIKYKNVEI